MADWNRDRYEDDSLDWRGRDRNEPNPRSTIRGDEEPGYAHYGRYADTPRRTHQEQDLAEPARTPRRRFGRYYGSTGDWTGVGSAAGYMGFGGPGWTPGGFGDPGYNTSGFGSSDYGQSRTGGYSGNITNQNWRLPASGPHVEEHMPRVSHRGKGPRNYQRSDDRIRDEVCELLSEHEAIDASEIEVAVAEAEVTLSGNVDNRRTRRLAEDVAESVRGVRDVHNRLKATS